MERKIFTDKWILEYQKEERIRLKKRAAELGELYNPSLYYQYDALKKHYDKKRKEKADYSNQETENTTN